MKKSLKPCFKASMQDDGVLEMLVYDDIGKTWDGKGVTAADVKVQLDSAAPAPRSFFESIHRAGTSSRESRFTTLYGRRRSPCQVCIDGIAASSASIIAMAGDEIEWAATP